eukprot:586397-Prorocentrum_minimum.AAC.1
MTRACLEKHPCRPVLTTKNVRLLPALPLQGGVDILTKQRDVHSEDPPAPGRGLEPSGRKRSAWSRQGDSS